MIKCKSCGYEIYAGVGDYIGYCPRCGSNAIGHLPQRRKRYGSEK